MQSMHLQQDFTVASEQSDDQISWSTESGVGNLTKHKLQWISISPDSGGNAQGPPLVRGVLHSFDHSQASGGRFRNESGCVYVVFVDFSQYQPKHRPTEK